MPKKGFLYKDNSEVFRWISKKSKEMGTSMTDVIRQALREFRNKEVRE